jgi:hypothetical protein
LPSRASEPDIAFDSAGNAVAVWAQSVRKGGLIGRSMTSASFIDAIDPGNPWQDPVAVTTLTTDGTAETGPRVAMVSANTYVVVAEHEVGVGPKALVAYRCALNRQSACDKGGNDGGASLPMPSDGLTGSVQGFDLAATSNGRILLAWNHLYTANQRSSVWTTILPPSDTSWTPPHAVDLAGEQIDGGDVSVPRVVLGLNAGMVSWCQKTTGETAAGCFMRRLAFNPGSVALFRLDTSDALTGIASDATAVLGPTGTSGIALWTRTDNVDGSLKHQLLSRSFDLTNGVAATVTPVTSSPASLSVGEPMASLASDGKGLAVWVQDGKVMANRYK